MRFFYMLIFSLLFACVGQQADYPEFLRPTEKSSAWLLDIKNSDTLQFSIPKINTWETANGIKIHYLPNYELPVVQVSLIIPGGTYLSRQMGFGSVSAAIGALMRTGGAGNYSPEEFDLILEELAAEMSASFAAENFQASFSCLNSEADQVFALFSDMILSPQFSERRLDTWKIGQLDDIHRRKDKPSTIASIAFQQLIYQDTPYADISDSKSINEISRTDLLRLHRRFIVPNHAHIVVTGAIDHKMVNAMIAKYFSNWQVSLNALPELLQPHLNTSPGIYFIPGNYTQSTVYIGQPGAKRLEKDHYAIQVFNEIFGASSFTSRLFQDVRERKGLAYSVFGGTLVDVIPGRNIIFLQSRTEATVNAIQEAINTFKRIQEKPVGKDELTQVIKNIENSYVFNYDDTNAIALRKAMVELKKYPDNYEENYLQNIRKVSREDVLQVAKTRWDLNNFIILVVGAESAYTQLESAFKGIKITKLKFNEKLEL